MLLPPTAVDVSVPSTIRLTPVEEWTDLLRNGFGEDWRSELTTLLVTKPLALLVLLLLAVALRWFLHRVIDRLVRRAAEGLPSPVLRRRHDKQGAHPPTVLAGRRV